MHSFRKPPVGLLAGYFEEFGLRTQLDRNTRSIPRHRRPLPDFTLADPLPNNLDAERCVLGAILLDNKSLATAVEHLRAEDFFFDSHQRIFTQMLRMNEVRLAIDLHLLIEELNSRGELDKAGGAAVSLFSR